MSDKKGFGYLISIFILLISSNLFATEYILESSSSVESDEIIINESIRSKVINIERRWTDSLGEFGTGKCHGHVLHKSNEVILNGFCEMLASNGDKFWLQLSRESELGAGIGKVKYLNGTGKYIKFISLECKYAVKYMNKEINFYRHICNLPE